MDTKIFLIILILITVLRTSTGKSIRLKCYACSSSSSIYDIDCDQGTSKVRSGTCPTNKKHYCIIRRTNYTDGSGSVLRDCSSKPSTLDFSCSSDLCNHATMTHRNKKIYFEGNTCGFGRLDSLSSLFFQTLEHILLD
uniref:Protein sleepless n=1 Tax=Daphnia galeata TaxID=27404 RepID=A0A8J2S2L6_9CRUS|nr:unnamed protein product [Daphnia galeata]